MSHRTAHAPLVYYARSDDLIKIGVTAHFRKRMQAQHFTEVLAVEPGGHDLEVARHAQFAEYRAIHPDRLAPTRGPYEWFSLGERLMAHIKALQALHDLPDMSTLSRPRLGPDAKTILPLLPPLLIQVPAGTVERLIAKVVIDGESGCWRRPVGISGKGYSQFWFSGKLQAAHRFSHTMFVGPILDGHEVDHVKARGCRFKDCIRPSHLEAVTGRENTLRGGNMAAIHARVTHCPANHEYTEANTYVYPDGRRGCRTCIKGKGAARHQRLKNDPVYREQRRVRAERSYQRKREREAALPS